MLFFLNLYMKMIEENKQNCLLFCKICIEYILYFLRFQGSRLYHSHSMVLKIQHLHVILMHILCFNWFQSLPCFLSKYIDVIKVYEASSPLLEVHYRRTVSIPDADLKGEAVQIVISLLLVLCVH